MVRNTFTASPRSRLGQHLKAKLHLSKIGGKDDFSKYSGRRKYDIRLDDANEETRSRSDRNFRLFH
jgi:hypothetical protein